MALTKIDTSLISENFSNYGIRSASIALGAGSSITPDFNSSNFFTWSIDGDKTLNLPPVNPGIGIWYIVATNDVTGGHVLSLDSNYNLVGNTAYNSTSNLVNLITISSNGSRYDVWYQLLG